MAASANDNDDEISGINVTPFVDIALVLLIIFLVTAKYIVSQAIPVDLPEAATGEQQQSSTVSVSVDRAGALFVDATGVNESQLVQAVRSRFAQQNDIRAVISADRATPHGRVTQVIDLVRQAGVTKFAIQTEQPADEATP